MKFICSGTTGIDKQMAVEEFKNFSKGKKDVEIKIISLESILKEKGGFDDITLFLNSYNWQAQKNAWEIAFRQILDDIEKDESEIVILCTHLVYYRNSRFLLPFNMKLIEKFDPDGFMTIIDDIYLLKKRIQNRSETSPYKTELRLRDLIAWRSIETNLTDMLCLHLSYKKQVTNYLISVKHPISTVYNLIFEPDNLKTYIAHPISSTRDKCELVNEIEKFKLIMHENFTVFDPTTIDERVLTKSLQEQYPEWKKMSKGELADSVVEIEMEKRWPIRHSPLLCQDVSGLFPIDLPADEIVEVIQDIDNQIQNRDYRLISQSNALVAYRPNLGAKLSTGVFSEMQYARDVAFKPCYMYFPEEDGTEESTPFKGRGSVYLNIDSMIESLLRHNVER